MDNSIAIIFHNYLDNVIKCILAYSVYSNLFGMDIVTIPNILSSGPLWCILMSELVMKVFLPQQNRWFAWC